MFLIYVQIDSCLNYPVDVLPYARFVLACECNEVIVKQRTQMDFFVLEKHFFLHLCGRTVCILRYIKSTKGQKTNCIQLVLATQYMCVQLNKAKWFQLFFNCF